MLGVNAMAGWEYKVVPAPTKGLKGKAIKGPEGRFAHALETLMNDMARDGWEFQRAETLPSIERSGLTGSTTEWRNLLVFRRTVDTAMDDFEPELLPAPKTEPPLQTPVATAEEPPAFEPENTVPPGPAPRDAEFERYETDGMTGITTSLQKLAARRSGSDIAD